MFRSALKWKNKIKSGPGPGPLMHYTHILYLHTTHDSFLQEIPPTYQKLLGNTRKILQNNLRICKLVLSKTNSGPPKLWYFLVIRYLMVSSASSRQFNALLRSNFSIKCFPIRWNVMTSLWLSFSLAHCANLRLCVYHSNLSEDFVSYKDAPSVNKTLIFQQLLLGKMDLSHSMKNINQDFFFMSQSVENRHS